MAFLPGNYKKCIGMNRNGVCVARNHLGHKRDMFGTWYGQVPSQPTKKLEHDKRPPSKRKKKRWWE